MTTAIGAALDQEVASYRTPTQVYDMSRIEANLELLRRSLGDRGMVLYAVKSMPAPVVIELAGRLGVGFEVSAPAEYELLPADLTGSTVSLNAPAPVGLSRYRERGNRLHVHVEDPALADGHRKDGGTTWALRLSHTSLGLETQGPDGDRPSRFGTTLDAFVQSAPRFRDGTLSGVHIHSGSEANTSDYFRSALAVVLDLSREHDIPLGYVNLGGGLHMLDDEELRTTLGALADDAQGTQVIVEPGRVLCRGAGYLLSRVVATRRIDDTHVDVRLDSSYECHAKWSRLEWHPPRDIGAVRRPYDSTPSVEPGRQVLYFTGASCSERDVLGVYEIEATHELPVAVGDVLTFGDLDGYAFAWSTPFNGVPAARARFI